MKIIIDNNILFSLMKPDSSNSKLFSLLKVEFFAPKFLMKEFNKYQKECLGKSGLTKKEFDKRKEEILKKIKLIEFKEYKNFLTDSIKFSPDKDDSPYFALSLKLQCPIWSNDKKLKDQEKINVLSTEEIINLLF